MWLRTSAEKLILFYLLTIGNTTPTKKAEEPQEPGNGASDKVDQVQKKDNVIEVAYEGLPSKTEFPLEDVTTKSSFRIVELFDSSTQNTLATKHLINDTDPFKPSVHLGEITRPRFKVGPFNRLHHVKFENNIDPGSHAEQTYVLKLPPEKTGPYIQEGQRIIHNFGNPDLGGKEKELTQQSTRVKFDDGTGFIVEDSGIRYEDAPKYQPARVKPIIENAGPHYEVMENQEIHQNIHNPPHNYELILGNPAKFQALQQNHDLLYPTGFGGSTSPYHQGLYDQNHYQLPLPEYQTMRKPDNSVVYVHQQESSFTQTSKFPYPFYQAPIGYHDFAFVENHHMEPYMKKRRISPWKKILHLIGAFLPLGLLLVALTPSVVKIDNTTQPNIVLSKLRVADLPMEHKHGRILDDSAKDCEDRAMCKTIVAGGQEGSNLLQQALWSIAIRTSEKTARDNGLEEVFEAAKKKDCSTIVC